MDAALQTWLEHHCRRIPGASHGAIVLSKSDAGPATLAASWPIEAGPDAELLRTAQIVLATRRAALQEPGSDDAANRTRAVIGVPLQLDGASAAAFVVRVPLPRPEQQRGLIALVERAAAHSPRSVSGSGASPSKARPAAEDPRRVTLELVTAALEPGTFQGAAMAVTTQLAVHLGCERVSLGFLERRHVRLAALSHSASFDDRTRLARDIAAAMEESIDQEAVVSHPPRDTAALEVERAHAELCDRHGARAAVSFPLLDRDEIVGALTLEQSGARILRLADLQLCEQVGALLAPILMRRRREERPALRQLLELLGSGLRPFSLKRPGHRLLALLAATAILIVSIVPASYRISAPATLEGRVQRAVVAASDGYVAGSGARAGDIVKRGDVLGALDESDLRLERRRWAGKAAQINKEYRAASALHDLAETSILRARHEQARAELDLLDEKIRRTRLLAPFDGIVVKGDLSQSLGSPVQRGDLLFEVAPLDRYRIILEVDEREISSVAAGQPGELTLSALPNRTFPLVVERITPVSTSAEGRNFFRVEAQLENPSELLRPGMEGLAKIVAGRRSLMWIWTHNLIDWLNLLRWSWLP